MTRWRLFCYNTQTRFRYPFVGLRSGLVSDRWDATRIDMDDYEMIMTPVAIMAFAGLEL